MRQVGLAVGIVALLFASFAFAQTYGSIGGFGSVLYPGTGHPPPQGGVFNPARPNRGVAVGPGFGAPVRQPRPNHPSHDRGSVVAVPVPVYVGGYGNGYGGYDASGYGQQAPPDQGGADTGAPPSVVINQNFVPERANPSIREYDNLPPTEQPSNSGVRMYQAPPTHPYADQQDQQAAAAPRRASDEPTIYLIALRDHTIVQALGYWMEGGTLHYVNAEHSLNQLSPDLIDRSLSQRLNDERGVEFKLPR
ncbi:MAG TPA: hypothetical protein VKU01_30345 [Bryobacteraceae bacterium]|nr:hypothetical protein [Bryobacteraceae bacterium]